MHFNKHGLTTLALLGGVSFGAVMGAGATWATLHRGALPEAPHIHDDVTTHGEWVKYANAKGDSVRAYVAYPERTDKAPAIIVLHENMGLTNWEPTVADDFAKKGYIAIAPDLVSSRFGSAPTPDSGRKLIPQLTPAGVVADLDATYKYVSARPAANGKVGMIGFCWGGGNTWKYAAANPNLKAAVACYGPVDDTLMLKSVKAPVLGVYGENDARVNAMIPAITSVMSGIKVPYDAQIYKGTGHGFLKPGRTGNGTPEAARALADIDAFFAKHLGK